MYLELSPLNYLPCTRDLLPFLPPPKADPELSMWCSGVTQKPLRGLCTIPPLASFPFISFLFFYYTFWGCFVLGPYSVVLRAHSWPNYVAPEI